MLYKENEQIKQELVDKALENWPESYYQLTGQMERKEVLQRALDSEIDIEKNRFRQQVYLKRYQVPKGKNTGMDCFMSGWLNMLTIVRQGNSIFTKKSNAKRLRTILQTFGILDLNEKTVQEQEIYEAEWNHFARQYFHLCAESKEYQSYVLGMGKLNDDALLKKMALEIYDVFQNIGSMAGLEAQDLERFQTIVEAAFGDTFENGEKMLKKI